MQYIMANWKKSFLMYCDLIHTVNKMTNEDAWLLLKHMLEYTNDNNPEPPNTVVDLVFEPIKQQLKRDLDKWKDETTKRSEAGKKWMESRRNKDKDVITKITNDNTVINAITNISDNVNVNVNDIEINYNTEILDLVEKFTSIKENAYNETQATIKKIGRKKYVDNQYNTIEKLIRAGHTLEQIEDVAIFCTKDEFRKWNVKSLCKLDQANKEWVKYINVLLDKIK